MRQLIPNSALVLIPDAGHTIHAEQPERYQSAILSFLSPANP
jgi:pimeloyl-ACP methyl ester carboxylesterase